MAQAAAQNPHGNRLLAALSHDVRERLLPNLELVPMRFGKALYESGDELLHVYFPTDSIIVFDAEGELRDLMLRYTQVLLTQTAQTAVCNRHHTIDQQLCRWLLTQLDRLSGSDLVITQEMIATMLGVRREGVTEAARRLQRLNVISYQRGHITVLDRPALENLTCECYAVVKEETDRLLPYDVGMC